MKTSVQKLAANALFTLVITLFSAGVSTAQSTQAFDIGTFRIPKGWDKQVSDSALQISTEDKAAGTFCLITVYRSIPGTDDSKKNFQLAWKAVVMETIGVTTDAQMQPSENSEPGWKAEMGSAAFEKEGTKGVVVLVTVTGFGKMVNTVILTNSGVYESTITAFLESADLRKPDTDPAPVKQSRAIELPSPSSDGLTSNNWKQSQNRKDAMGNYAGYSANTYQFLANGSYKFSQVTFQNYAPKYYLEDEEGTYKVAGGTITLTPKKGSFRVYRSTREDPVLKSGSLPLTTVHYGFEVINLNNNMTLLLSPVDGIETKRDGQFSFWLNGEKRKTYSYNSVNAAGELIQVQK
jgi:hypothetical protein